MDISDLIAAGRIKITCSKCKTKFKDKDGNGKCPNCGTPWQIGDAINTQKVMRKTEKSGTDYAKRISGAEAREV